MEIILGELLGRKFQEQDGDVSVWAPLGDSLDVGVCICMKENSASWTVGALLFIQSALGVTTVCLCMSSELESCLPAVRVVKVCKVFRVCVHACPVDPALCTTARSREFLFRTKTMFLSFFQGQFFSSGPFYTTFYHVVSCLTHSQTKALKNMNSALKWWSLKDGILGGIFVHLMSFNGVTFKKRCLCTLEN